MNNIWGSKKKQTKWFWLLIGIVILIPITIFFLGINFYPLVTSGVAYADLTVTYQEDHKNETILFPSTVVEGWAIFLWLQNLDNQTTYYLGFAYHKDAAIHFTHTITSSQMKNNSELFWINCDPSLERIFLMRGYWCIELQSVLIIDLEWKT